MSYKSNFVDDSHRVLFGHDSRGNEIYGQHFYCAATFISYDKLGQSLEYQIVYDDEIIKDSHDPRYD